MDPREITPGGTGRTVPANRKEEALWLLERLVPGSNVNNVPGATVRVEGRLDPDLLVASVRALLRRHPVMRTVFHAEGTRLTKEVLPAGEARLPLESRQLAEDELDAALREFVVRPFSLDGSALVRLACFSTESADVLCLAVHHLVFDNTSSIVFLEELAAVYDLAAAGQDLESAPVEEVAAWQEHAPDGSSLGWWREHLDGLDPDSGELWLGSRPAGSGTLAGASVVHDLSAPAAAVLKGARRSLKAPDAVVMLAASYLLLARHGAGPDFAVGLPVNIRSQAASRTIGYHVNILPLRVRVDPALSFREFTLRVRNLFMDAVAHADAPVDVLLPRAPRIGATWRSALFRHVFNFLPGRGTDTYRIGGMDGRLEIVETGSSKFDIEFLVVPLGEGYQVKAIHSTDVHTAAEVEALLRRYDALLTALGAEPDRPVGEVIAWPDADREAVAAAHSPAPQAPDVVEAVARHAAAAPHAVAVREPHRTTDYGQLWRAAEAVRASLARRGVGAEDVVGLRGPAGAELVAAALGVWLAGAAWTGAAPDATPEELAQAQVKAVVGDGPGDLPLVDPHTAPAAGHTTGGPGPDRAALVVTGGAADGPRLTHRDLAVQLAWLGAALGEPGRPLDAVARAPLGSAAALAEVWLPLATGGQVVLVAEDETLPATLEAAPGALLRTSGAQAWALLERVEARLEGRPVLVGPDALTEPVTRRLVAAGAQVYAARGDGGGWWAGAPVTGPTVPALRPLPGTRAAVAAPDGTELPVGVRGVVRVGGRDTGVVGRWTGEGTLEPLGAANRRLRRRGGEVRPEEVESLLAGHPGVSAAAVVPVGAADGDGPELVAVVARVGGLRHDDAKLLRELAEAAEARLPGAALPDRYAVVAALPLTADGLLDLDAVTALAGRADGGADADADADTDGAAAGYLPGLVALWRELIGRDDLDADANFFTSGGHSLLAAQLVQRVEERTGVKLKLADAFEHPTPARLADRLAAVAGA